MTADLTRAQWLAVEKAAVYLAPQGERTGRYIAMDKLREIIRKARRTNDQNALLWGGVYEQIIERGGEAMRGWEKKDLHEFFLIEVFGSVRVEMFGRVKLKPLHRSSSLTKAEFSDFLEHVVRFMAERGVVIDMPDDQRSAA